MFDYSEMIDIANTLIPEFGLPCDMKYIKHGEYDPSNPSGSTTEVKTIGNCVQTRMNYKYTQEFNNLIQAGDSMFICTESINPIIDAEISTELGIWQIINFVPIAPNGKAIIYLVHVRSA